MRITLIKKENLYFFHAFTAAICTAMLLAISSMVKAQEDVQAKRIANVTSQSTAAFFQSQDKTDSLNMLSYEMNDVKEQLTQKDTLIKNDTLKKDFDCSSSDYLKIRGITIPFPSICQTISPDLFGARKWLTKAGIGIHGYGQHLFQYDLLGNENGPQSYIGQKPTNTSYLFAYIQYDLGKIGLPKGSQLSFIPRWAYTDYYYSSEKGIYIGGLSVYIPISERVETLFGFMESFLPFYGPSTGSSISASPLGTASSIPIQLGLGAQYPMPYADIKFSSKDKKFYSKTAVARSLSPKGIFYDSEHRKHGLEWSVSGANALVVQEFGYQRQSTPGSGRIWLRTGGIYNWSEYDVFDEPGKTGDNFGFYLVGDIQFTQNKIIPPLGWYVNFRASLAPADRNVYTKDFSATFYKIGTFPKRLHDLVSLGISTSVFSPISRDMLMANGIQAEASSTTYSASYAFLIIRGLYLNTQLAYTDNPSFVPTNKNALVGGIALSLIW